MPIQKDPSLHSVDYIVAVIILAVPLGIGIIFAYRDAHKMTRLEYLLGGQRMSIVPVAMSIFVTFQSAISVIGVPSEIYSYGTKIIYFEVGAILSYFVCYFTFVPLMHPLEVTSIYQYLHLRYHSQVVRMFSTVMGCCQTTLYLSIALLSPALALQAVGGTPMWLSVLVVGFIGTIYTVIGGIKSVIWTDAFQTIIFFTGIIAVIIKGSTEVGGLSKAWSVANQGGRVVFNEFSPDPRVRLTFWGGIFGGAFSWLTTSYSQATLQRIRSLRTLQQAKISFISCVPFLCFYIMLLFMLGIVTYSYFSNMNCDPLEAGLITNQNQIVPFLVYYLMNDVIGMAGLFMSTLFCGTLSTLSSGINALAAITVEDILERPLRNVNERTATVITKISAAFYGLIICCLGYSAQYLDGPLTQMTMTIFGAFGTPILGMFLIGCAVPWANKYGAFAGGIVTLVFNLWINFGNQLYGNKPSKLPPVDLFNCGVSNLTMSHGFNYNETTSNYDGISQGYTGFSVNKTLQKTSEVGMDGFFFYNISYEWCTIFGLLICVLMGLGTSFCTRSKNWRKSQSNIQLIFPISRRLWSLSRGEDFQEFVDLYEFPKLNSFAKT